MWRTVKSWSEVNGSRWWGYGHVRMQTDFIEPPEASRKNRRLTVESLPQPCRYSQRKIRLRSSALLNTSFSPLTNLLRTPEGAGSLEQISAHLIFCWDSDARKGLAGSSFASALPKADGYSFTMMASSHGSAVGYNHQNQSEIRKRESWILSRGPGSRVMWADVTIHAGKLVFKIEFPNQRASGRKYRENLRASLRIVGAPFLLSTY